MKHRLISLFLCLLLAAGLFPSTALAAPDWPADVSIESDAGIVMDAASGAVLYGKNIHETYSPASITKVLTALIVLENLGLDEVVTFSRNAVYNVESNSSSAGYDTGDQATVKDCLYALLLKSANEAANALAEHLSGSTEAFAVLMNEKAAQLGCQESHFTNPSGLNDENHYVSAYDMALITSAAFNNEVFSEIVGTTYYELPPNKLNPEGQGISPGNKMVKPNWPSHYRPDVIGGKTGYTSIALNTLVICAEQKGTKLVTVILHSQATQYVDTKRLLDFGFRNFQTVKIADYDKTFSALGDGLKIAGLATSDKPILTLDPDSRITLPNNADFSDTETALDYTLPADAPEGAVARITYTMNERTIGQAYLSFADTSASGSLLPQKLIEVQPTALALAAESTGAAEERLHGEEPAESEAAERAATEPPKVSLKVPSILWKVLAGILAVAAIGAGTVFYITNRQKKEAEEQQKRRQRRAERLKEAGISEADFNLLIQKKHSESGDGSEAAGRRRGKNKGN